MVGREPPTVAGGANCCLSHPGRLGIPLGTEQVSSKPSSKPRQQLSPGIWQTRGKGKDTPLLPLAPLALGGGDRGVPAAGARPMPGLAGNPGLLCPCRTRLRVLCNPNEL